MKKLFVLLLVALLVMSSIVFAEGIAPTIISTACTTDADCASGQICGACPAGATCNSAKICLIAAGTTTQVVPAAGDANFPFGSSVIELCRYSRGEYGTVAGRGDREPRSNHVYSIAFANRDEYKFEATDIKADGTLVMEITKMEGAASKFGPYSVTLTESRDIVTIGPAGQELKVRYRTSESHEYLEEARGGNIGYNKMNGRCVSFDVAPTSWEDTNLPFGTIVPSYSNTNVWFNTVPKRMSISYPLFLNAAATPFNLIVKQGATKVAEETINNGETKVIGPLKVKYDGYYKTTNGKWAPNIYVSDKNAAVAAATTSVQAVQPAKKLGLFTRLFGKKTATNLLAAAPATETSSGSMAEIGTTTSTEKTYKSTTWTCYDGSRSGTYPDTECLTTTQWQIKAKEYCEGKCNAQNTKCGVNTFSLGKECITASELTRPSSERAAGVLKECTVLRPTTGGKTGTALCTEKGYPLCVTVLQQLSNKFYETTDKTCKGVQFYDNSYSLFLCSEIIEPSISDCLNVKDTTSEYNVEPRAGDMTDMRSYEVVCCR